MNHGELKDRELYKKCQEYGLNSQLCLIRFEGLLPEVYRRKLHRRRGYGSIYEFSSKLAGMSHEKVHQILKLADRLEDKPKLKELFEGGEVGYSKLEKVALIATAEDEGKWAVKVRALSKADLELCVQNDRLGHSNMRKNHYQQSSKWRIRKQEDIDSYRGVAAFAS